MTGHVPGVKKGRPVHTFRCIRPKTGLILLKPAIALDAML
jgi:hypothetical protein